MNELTKDQWEKSMSTGFGNGDHPINHNNPHHDKLVVKLENAEMSMSDVTKLIKYSEALQKMFNVNDDLEDWVKAKLNHACDYVATVRDYLKFYYDEKSLGKSDQEIKAGKQIKSGSVSEVEIYNEVLKDLIEDIFTEESSMAMGALKQLNNDAKELQSMLKPETQLEDWVKAKLNLAGEYLDDVYHHLDHFGSEGRKFDENINEEDYQGMVGFHELAKFYRDASEDQIKQMEDCLANENVECVKELVHQVTGMTMNNVKESVTDPRFFRFLAMTGKSSSELEDYIRSTQEKKKSSYVPPVMQNAYWISPSGELSRVSDHERWAKEMYPDAKDPKMEAFRHGYIRMVYSVLKNGRSQFDVQNIKTLSGGEHFNENGNSTLGIPPVKPNVMVVIDQFIKEKNKLTNNVTDGNLEEAMSIEENWKKMLGTAALAAATAFITPDAKAATNAKKPVSVQTVKKTSSKVFVNVDEIKTSTPSQKYTLKNEGAVRNYYLIGDKPHIGGGHHLDGSAGSRNNIRRIASMPNDNPETNKQLMRYVEGGPATAQDFSEVLLSNDQISTLFKYDYEEKVEIAKKKYKNFSNLPQLVQTMLVDSIFRGEKHPTTDKLVNSPNPNWNQVADAYLDDDEYRSSQGKGSGVFARMDRNVALLKRAGVERNLELIKRANTDIASLNKTKNEAI